MNKFIAENLIQQIKQKNITETSHLNIVSDNFGYHKIRDHSYDDDIMGIIENSTNQNHAIIFKSGLTFFVSTLHDINEGSEIRRYTGHSIDDLIELLNRKFSKADYEKPIYCLSNEEIVIIH